ncbi:MAG TPA: hypothetical protein VIA18_07425, partial [Polyangia bacterium]|nr:hypothetical protein [Polyangia bacterium]
LAGALTQLPIFVASGNGTPGPLDPPGAGNDVLEPAVEQTSVTFVHALAPLNAQLTTDFYGNGTHTWPYWQQELHRSFAMLMRALDR